MADESLRAYVIEILDYSQQMREALVASLSAAEKAEKGQIDDWDKTSIKAIIAHNTFWEDLFLKRLDALAQGAPPPNYDDYLALNDQNYKAMRDATWDAVWADAGRTSRQLREQALKLGEEGLGSTAGYGSDNRTPLWRNFNGNSFSHHVIHFSDFLIARGDLAGAEVLNKANVEKSTRFADDETRGTAIYNLACFYAKTNQPEKALEILPQALKLAPSLTEWSKKDSDLDSLRGLPAYKALYE